MDTFHVVPDRTRRDWYRAPADLMPWISHLPGVTYDRSGVWLHCTHLPTLPTLGVPVVVDNVWKYPARPIPAVENVTLRPSQLDAIAYAHSRRGTLLAMEMRTGKTASAIFAHDPSDGPLLIIAPLNVRTVWLDWIRRRWPDESPYVVEGLTYDRDQFLGARVVLAHYDVIRKHTTLGVIPGTLVLDECHLLGNPKSQRTRACLMYASVARRVIALSGTPMWNRPLSLWPVLAACNPGAWGRPWQFAKRYGNPEYTAYGVEYTGASNEDELRARTSEVMFVRTWRDVQPDLPPIVRSIETVPVSHVTRLRLDHLAEEERGQLARSVIGELSGFRRMLGQLKVDYVVELAERVLTDGVPVVVWAHHRSVATAIAAALDGSVLITGEVPVAQRAERLAAWQHGTSPNALVLTLAIGQVGIDLSRSHHCIFGEVDWTPAVVYQAEMRTFSAERPMAATYVIVDHPVEHMLVEAILGKASDADRLGLPPAEAARVLASAFGCGHDDGTVASLASAFLAAAERILDGAA